MAQVRMTPDIPMLEKCARAMLAAEIAPDVTLQMVFHEIAGDATDWGDATLIEAATPLAIAVLNTLRNPDEGMVAAGNAAEHPTNEGPARASFQAMIDHVSRGGE